MDLIARLDGYDFIELPLDLYIDPAQSALLDPGDARLREIAAARPCIWRGSVLSLGSVERPGDPAPDPRVIDRIRLLMQRAGATRYCDVIGFRSLDGRDLGVPRSLPRTNAAARWIVARYIAACEALGNRILLQPAACSAATPGPGGAHAGFLRQVVALAGCELSLSTANLDPIATETGADPAEIASSLPSGCIAMLTTSGTDDAEWALLSQLAAVSAARAIVIRRTHNLFPLDVIVECAHRARRILAEERRVVARGTELEPEPPDDDPDELANLRRHQSDLIDFYLNPASAAPPTGMAPAEEIMLASQPRSWQVWRERIEDTYKAQQIARFLAEDQGRHARRRG